MCKVFAMTNTTQFKVNSKFINTVRNEVCRHADQDGFGYAVLTKNGEIGGERTIRPLNFRPLINPELPRITSGLPITLKANNGFGVLDLGNAKSFIGHGRLSTNTVCLQNTHPFTNGEVALIHNGVVTDPTSAFKNLTSTCDSELLLRAWEKGGMEEVEKLISGYYAVAVLDKHGLLHIIRDDRADLFISYCRTVDSFIISTTSEIIRNVAKEMKWKIEHPEEILEKSYTVFDMNEIVKHRDIVPRSATYGTYSGYNNNYPNNGYSTYNSGTSTGKKSQETTTAITAASSARDTSSKTVVSGTKTPAAGWDEPEYASYAEVDAASEPVPKYKELPEKTTTSSSSSLSTGTSSSEEGGGIQTSLASLLVDDVDGTGDPDMDQRIDLIVSEVEEWRNSRAGSDV
jgi:predicted glutamine amidotransferase